MAGSPTSERTVDQLERELEELRAKLRELEVRADIDALTEVFNRRGFERELNRTLSYLVRYGGSAAVVYVDLDDFKPVNDRYGHAAGDQVLRGVASAMVRAVRESDSVGRLGGDEFAVILWNLGAAQAQAKALALEAAIAGAVTDWHGEPLSVGASAGVAMISDHEPAAELLMRADRAMYARKSERALISARVVRQ